MPPEFKACIGIKLSLISPQVLNHVFFIYVATLECGFRCGFCIWNWPLPMERCLALKHVIQCRSSFLYWANLVTKQSVHKNNSSTALIKMLLFG